MPAGFFHKAKLFAVTLVRSVAPRMRIAMLTRPQEHYSLLLYRNAMAERLPAFGIELHEFAPDGQIPVDCDIVWDPGQGMRHVPEVLFGSRMPIIVTVLGLRSFGASIEDLAVADDEFASERALKTEVQAGWEGLRRTLAGVIAISKSCANEVVSHLGVPHQLVHPIYLAVERAVFVPQLPILRVPRDYFLHVSLGGTSRKNLARMLEAYERMPADMRIPLLIKFQGRLPSVALPAGVKIVPGHCSDADLAKYYRGARCLLFPSIYEGFGLPILEAMSCGCPVITSNSTACAEIAGGAALLVDPLSTESIASAMIALLRDDDLALELAEKGRQRAAQFDWDITAAAHARLFSEIAHRPLQ
jgi:glycosyltransferase involved in cell wall biosynthesis